MPNKFKHQVVRELYWLIASPSLFLPSQFDEKQEADLLMDELHKLDAFPEDLTLFMNELKSTRLGFRFEHLFAYWLRLKQVKIVRRNWQIIDKKRTLGEFDFLVESNSGITHWETAIKFYLAYKGKWYGPNAHDRLDLKSTLIFEKQLQFARQAEVLQQLEKARLKVDNAEVFAKGILFAHAYENYSASLPKNVNPKSVVGKWLHFADFAQMESKEEWMLIPHHSWLDPIPDMPFQSYTEVCQLLEVELQLKDSIMLARKHGDALEKWFVVKDTWPTVNM